VFNAFVVNTIIGSQEMGTELIIAGTLNLLEHFLYACVGLFIAIEIFIFVDRNVFDKIDIQKELHDGNLAVSIFASIFVVIIGIIISASMATVT
jgi:uncharacterized membrane protein YjfL (UPF0719 family)